MFGSGAGSGTSLCRDDDRESDMIIFMEQKAEGGTGLALKQTFLYLLDPECPTA